MASQRPTSPPCPCDLFYQPQGLIIKWLDEKLKPLSTNEYCASDIGFAQEIREDQHRARPSAYFAWADPRGGPVEPPKRKIKTF